MKARLLPRRTSAGTGNGEVQLSLQFPLTAILYVRKYIALYSLTIHYCYVNYEQDGDDDGGEQEIGALEVEMDSMHPLKHVTIDGVDGM